MIITKENKPEEIILSFTNIQGKYIKTLPLHSSQEILIDNKKEFRIKLNLVITNDFIIELLSMGENIKVIKPEKLKKRIKNIYSKALNNYSKDKKVK